MEGAVGGPSEEAETKGAGVEKRISVQKDKIERKKEKRTKGKEKGLPLGMSPLLAYDTDFTLVRSAAHTRAHHQ